MKPNYKNKSDVYVFFEETSTKRIITIRGSDMTRVDAVAEEYSNDFIEKKESRDIDREYEFEVRIVQEIPLEKQPNPEIMQNSDYVITINCPKCNIKTQITMPFVVALENIKKGKRLHGVCICGESEYVLFGANVIKS